MEVDDKVVTNLSHQSLELPNSTDSSLNRKDSKTLPPSGNNSSSSITRHSSLYKNDSLDIDFTRKRNERDTAHLRKLLKEDCLQRRRARYNPCFRQILHDQAILIEKEKITIDNSQQSPNVEPEEESIELEKKLHFLIENIGTENNAAAVHEIRFMLSTKEEPPINDALDAGLLPKIIKQIVAETEYELLFDLLWILTNLTCGSLQSTNYLLTYPAVLECLKNILTNNYEKILSDFQLHLIKATTSTTTKEEEIIADNKNDFISFDNNSTVSNVDIVSQAIWTLGNIAGDGHEARDAIVKWNFIPILRKYLELSANAYEKFKSKSQFFSLFSLTVWCLSNLCRRLQDEEQMKCVILNESSSFYLSVSPWLGEILARILFIIEMEEIQLISDTCWALMFLTEGPHERIDAIIKTGVIRYLIQLTVLDSSLIAIPALRVIGNLVTGDDVQTHVVISAGLLPCLGFLLSTARAELSSWRMQICWILSNITAGSRSQKQAVIDAGLIPIVVEVMNKGDIRSRREALWVIRNLVSGCDVEQLTFLFKQDKFVSSLCHLLSMNDINTVLLALECIHDILTTNQESKSCLRNFAHLLEECGGLNVIEYLQGHQQDKVYQKSHEIIDLVYGHLNGSDNLSTDEEVKSKKSTSEFALDLTNEEKQISKGSAGDFHF